MATITATTGIYNHRIFINGILHLSIKIEELVGVQSYKNEPTKYSIDYYLRTGIIKTEYDREDTWKGILLLLYEKRIA